MQVKQQRAGLPGCDLRDFLTLKLTTGICADLTFIFLPQLTDTPLHTAVRYYLIYIELGECRDISPEPLTADVRPEMAARAPSRQSCVKDLRKPADL